MRRHQNEISLTPHQEAFLGQYSNCQNVSIASVLTKYGLSGPGDSYFVYLLCDPLSSKIFYVGKGKGKRPYQHMRECLTGKGVNIKKHQAIREIQKSGNAVEVFYFAINLSEPEAYKIERSVIKRLGRSNLTNIASGINFQTDADRAAFSLSRIKNLSVICAEGRSPSDMEMYFRIVREFKLMCA